VTIKEVAEVAGVSTATVSRMINENGFVSSATKEKIRQAIKDTGYKPSLRKRGRGANPSLRWERKNVIMIWTTGKDRQRSLTGQDMMRGMTEVLQKMGTSLTVAHIKEDDDIPLCLLDSKLDGILIHGPTPPPAICEQLKKYPVAWLLQRGAGDCGDRVQPHHASPGTM